MYNERKLKLKKRLVGWADSRIAAATNVEILTLAKGQPDGHGGWIERYCIKENIFQI